MTGIYDASASSTRLTITQTAHGFNLGDPVRYDGAQWVLAQADAVANTAMGIVSRPEADEFDLCISGLMSWPAHGLTLGEYYYLSDTAAGVLQPEPPTGADAQLQTVLQVVDDDTVQALSQGPLLGRSQHLGYFDPDTGLVDTPAGAALPAADASNAGKWYRASADSTINQAQATAAGVDADLIPFYPVDVNDPALGGDTGIFELNYIISDGTNWTLRRSVGTGLRDLYDVDVVTNLPQDGDLLSYDGAQNRWVPAPAVASDVVKEVVTQVGHGFTTLTNIYFDQTAGEWAAAQATSELTLKAATVGEVIDADTFDAVYYGVVNAVGHGYITGSPAYLAEAAGGGNVLTPPVAPGTFAQATFEALDEDNVKVLDQAVIGNV